MTFPQTALCFLIFFFADGYRKVSWYVSVQLPLESWTLCVPEGCLHLFVTASCWILKIYLFFIHFHIRLDTCNGCPGCFENIARMCQIATHLLYCVRTLLRDLSKNPSSLKTTAERSGWVEWAPAWTGTEKWFLGWLYFVFVLAKYVGCGYLIAVLMMMMAVWHMGNRCEGGNDLINQKKYRFLKLICNLHRNERQSWSNLGLQITILSCHLVSVVTCGPVRGWLV